MTQHEERLSMLIEPFGDFQREKEGLCLRCGSSFFYRSNKKFCTANCRKRYSEHKANSKCSNKKRTENERLFERAARLGEEYYKVPPQERLGFIKDIIDLARSGQDQHLRLVLSNLVLLQANRESPRNYFIGNRYHNSNIAKIANQYCRHFWNAGIKAVAYGTAPEPDTGEC